MWTTFRESRPAAGRRFSPCRASVVRVVCMVREASIDPERVTLRSLPSSIPCGPRSEAWPSCGECASAWPPVYGNERFARRVLTSAVLRRRHSAVRRGGRQS